MRRHSFFWKLFAGNLLMMGVILFVAGFFSYRYLNANYQRDSRENQGRLARITKLYFQRDWPRLAGQIDADCKRLFANRTMRLTVIADDGRVLGDSQARAATMENHRTDDRPEVLQALKGQAGRDIRSSETLGSQFRYFAEPIEKGGKILGVVRLAMPVRAIAEGRNVIRNALTWAAMVAVGVAVVIAGMLSWMWHKPIRQITETARAIAAGNLSAKAPAGGSDELAQLARALNEMRESLATQIKTITSQREHLSVIVRNLREGVIALDSEGKIVLMNAAAGGLFAADSQETIGLHLQSVVRVPDVLDIFHQAMETGKSAGKQIEFETGHGLRILDLHAANFSSPGQDGIAVLLVVRDITEIARTAAMKTEFVANASHELRTPLATIRAAVDSLAMVEPGDTDALAKFTDMLNRHVARLEEMTKDLLDLNIAETADRRGNIEKIDLAELGNWAENHFAQAARDKGVELKIIAAYSEAAFESDQERVKSILQNLIDNAVKFTPAAGLVECSLGLEAGHLCIEVRDTGRGIPAEMQDKVFERFFQVEPSRTGDTKIRGTGLGLAIVKHATERLNGLVNLKSAPGKGTTITVTIP